jgi:sigma-E factor negative regulatory protein RseC
MKSPVGTIIAIGTTTATVEVERVAACPRCAAGRGCGAGLLAGSTRPVSLAIALPPDSEFRAGDSVVLALHPAHLLKAAALVYGLPLAGLLLALGGGQLFAAPLGDLEAVAWAVAGLAAGVAGGRWRLRRQACLQQFVPVIEGRANAAAKPA